MFESAHFTSSIFVLNTSSNPNQRKKALNEIVYFIHKGIINESNILDFIDVKKT